MPGNINWSMENVSKEMGTFQIYPVNEMMNMLVDTISVDNLDEYIEKIKANGGEIITDPKEYPDVGRVAYFKDPENNIFGVMQFFPGAMDQES
jgi:predicted enzyme related to lactoylglutathione lyase